MASPENMSDRQAQFMHVTGVDSDRAKFYLESAAWDLQVALSSFYEDDVPSALQDLPQAMDDDRIAGIDVEPSSTARLLASAAGDQSDEELETDDRRGRPIKAGAGKAVGGGKKQSSSGRPAAEYAKYGSIYGLPQANTSDDDDDDEEKGQAFYAGGSERSGQQIIGPGKKPQDVVAGLFKSAKEHGAETVNETSGEATKKSPAAFRGTGYVLGATEGDSEVVASTSSNATSSGRDAACEVTLKMWRNGFSVDDGPLRDYADPGNREFLNCIRQGEIPQELIRLVRGSEVSLNMEDHRQTDYERPKTNLQAFTGAGHLLGSPVPNIAIPATKASTIQQSSAAVVNVDGTQPLTNVQIRLVDGTRLTAKLNHTHTVGDLRRYITSERPQYASTVFALMTTFPNKELTDDTVSLKDANLFNAVIVQKMQ